jgi:hypothetical protein
MKKVFAYLYKEILKAFNEGFCAYGRLHHFEFSNDEVSSEQTRSQYGEKTGSALQNQEDCRPRMGEVVHGGRGDISEHPKQAQMDQKKTKN